MLIDKLLGRASIHGWELRQGIESLVAQVARANGVTPPIVEWSASTTTAAVDMNGKMFLACPADDAVITRAVFVKYVGFVLHEMLHLIYTTRQDCRNTYLHGLWNGIEDAWIERKGIAQGITGNIGEVLTTLVEGMAREALASVQDWTDFRQYPFALAIYLRPHCSVRLPLARGLEPIFQEAGRRLERATSSADNLRIAEWVLSQLQKPQTEPEQGGNEKQDGQPEEQSDGQPDGQPDGEDDRPGDARVPEVHTEPAEVEPTLEGGDGADYEKNSRVVGAGFHLNATDDFQPTMVQGRLRHEVKRLFDNTGMEAWQRNRKAGAINVSALHRLGQSDRLFQSRLEQEGTDSACVLLLDMSASMRDKSEGRGRRRPAINACLSMYEALAHAGAQVTVVTFCDAISVAVPWGSTPAKARSLLRKARTGGGTQDYHALRYAHEMLLHRHEPRRVCIVLTDGLGDEYNVKRQIASGENLGLTTLAIGIESDISHVYPQSVNVWELSDLGRAALGQLKVAA